MLTLTDLAERMKHLDEITLLEVLDIKSDELVERFLDRVEDRYEYLSEDLQDVDLFDDYESE